MRNRSLVLAMACLLIGWCATVYAQVVQVSGKVTFKQADGTVVPVSGALIKFIRTGAREEATGRTDQDGKYVIKSYRDAQPTQLSLANPTLKLYGLKGYASLRTL